MMNLFSVFDPLSPMNLNWLTLMIPLLLISQYKLILNPWMMFSNLIKTFIIKEMMSLLSRTSLSMINLSSSIIIIILTYNILGLFPYIFTPTSHLMITLSMALPLWMGSITYSMFYQTKLALAHLVPMSTPYLLMPIMVMIESISLLIRPITLSVRLAANMIAGHLLITLISSQSTNWMNPYSYFGQLFLNVLEMGVACIQAYVFVILFSLYMSEIK
uniref:ATP synthase subunit a n=1 Tax=Paratemnoides elongatus TaxID=51805 RepID=H9MFH3_9ARAC|nr:ATP synthase F0 subunit 6 [Paratemnoides elongatus]AEX37718.1 ATP synthase F0 subunit 6 [Paratemnoides elongatus]